MLLYTEERNDHVATHSLYTIHAACVVRTDGSAYLISLSHEAGLRRGKVLFNHLPPSSPDQPAANVTLKLSLRGEIERVSVCVQ